MSKHPPDKYKCLKLRFTKVLDNSTIYNNKNVFNTIEDAIKRTNNIVIKSYMLLRLWILNKYESNVDIPIITKDTIKMSFKAVMTNNKSPSGNNLLLFNELRDICKNYITDKFEIGTKLSTILNYYSITMMTSIENNIKNNFINYVNKYVNSYFITKYQQEIRDKEFKKQLFKNLNILKKDLYENTSNSIDIFREWLLDNRNKIVPFYNSNNDNIYKILKNTPQICFKNMIYMNIELNKLNKKQFQFFPLQSNTILRNIQIDTSSLLELFEDKVTEAYKNIEIQKAIIWTKLFKLNHCIKKYVFDYTIITDGYSTALRFLNQEYVEEVKDKKNKMKQGKTIVNNRLRGLTKEDKIKEKKIIKEEKELIINNKKEEQKKLKEEEREREREKEREKTNKDNTNIKSVKEKIIKNTIKDEFPYIDDVNKDELKGNHIFIDPGKRSLLTMMDDNNKFISYTNREHMERTKRLKYSNKLSTYKTTLGITTFENTLSDFNSKSCVVEDFKNFIKKKLEVNEKVRELYNNNKFRQYKWYSFINKKRAEDNLLNKIEKEYSKEHIIIIGDWSIGKQMSNFISTPNITLKRKLKERFKVYNIDEYRTSCLNYKTEKRCENLILPSPITGNYYKMHSILTYKMENNRLGCINRDKNGCYNIKKLFYSYINSGVIPEVYRRGFKID